MDRLPEVVIQRILSFLSPEEAAQTIVLSKTWLRAWSTFPDFDFRQHIIFRKLAGGKSDSKQRKEKLAKFVDDNLLRYSKHNLPINKFSLNLTVFDCESASLLDKWLGMVVNMGVKHLVLRLDPPKSASYSLPPIIFASTQLTYLKVQGSRILLPNNFISLPLKNPVLGNSSCIKCCNLRCLDLRMVYLDEWIFQILCSSCFLIEKLLLKECWGLKNIQVSNLRKLVYLRVTATPNQIVHITETPNLESLYLWSRGFTITISASQSLKGLWLSDPTITVVSLHNLVSQCPLLEDLNLQHDFALDRVHLSSQTLKRLTLYECAALVEVKIDAPNLLFLRYVANQIPSFSFKFSLSEQFKFEICIRISNLDTAFFVRVKDLLMKLNHCEFHLVVGIFFDDDCFSIKDPREIPLLPQPKICSLKITTSFPLMTFSTLVHKLLWSCHPETLEVHWLHELDSLFIKFLFRELIDGRSPNCCSSDQVMCWRHYLNHMEVEYLKRIDGKLMPLPFDRKSFADGAMVPNDLSAIRFTFNWI